MPHPSRHVRPLSRRLILAAIALGLIVLAVAPLDGSAQTVSSTIVRALREGRDFRSRVRAALALGSSNDPAAVPHLVTALSSDEHPSVRAAAATGLGRLGRREAIAPLRAALSDRESVVRLEAQRALQRIETTPGARPTAPSTAPVLTASAPGHDRLPVVEIVPRASQIAWPSVRYVVVLGAMQNRSTFRDDALAQVLAQEVTRGLVVLRGVAVIQEGREPVDATREIQRRRLPKLRLEGSVTRIDRRPAPTEVSVRAEVSLMLMDDPGRNLRSVLNGAATGSGPRSGERRLAQQALAGAVRSAMSGAANAIASAGR